MADGDKMPDPRDVSHALDEFLSAEHPASLAAFEQWCDRVGAKSAIAFIAKYRRAIENSQRRE